MPAAVLTSERRASSSASSPQQPQTPPRTPCESVTVNIGDIPILLRPNDPEFCATLEDRYTGFTTAHDSPHAAANSNPACTFDIHLDPTGRAADEDARVTRNGSLWNFRRGDFDATWDPRAGHGEIRQCPNPYSIDTVLRITHSLVLAEQGGFLVHAASAIRNNRAFLFAGVSGAGKTTISRLAPPDATLLTDEISYVRRAADKSYTAYGTPFAGELARVGANTSAPLAALDLLVQGPENRIQPVAPIDAARALMRHILFFAEEKQLVARVFDSVLDFVSRVEVAQLVFTPDSRAWELIR
jgi:hypothetical protein